jgi:hypothetical protein
MRCVVGQQSTQETKMSSKKSKVTKVSTAEKPITQPQDDGLDLPASLRVENRKPLPAQTAKVEAKATEQKKPAKAQTPVKVKAAKKATAPSLSRTLKEFIVRSPKMPLDELVSKLEAAGFKGRSRVTIQTLQSDALTTLRAAAEAGLFPRWD